jgi:hypothetical protein
MFSLPFIFLQHNVKLINNLIINHATLTGLEIAHGSLNLPVAVITYHRDFNVLTHNFPRLFDPNDIMPEYYIQHPSKSPAKHRKKRERGISPPVLYFLPPQAL